MIRRLVADLNLPVRIEVCPTVREPDGLAMSSRNARLFAAGARAGAGAARGACGPPRGAPAEGERSAEALLDAARAAMLARGVEPEYVELVDPETLRAVRAAGRARRCWRSPRASARRA